MLIHSLSPWFVRFVPDVTSKYHAVRPHKSRYWVYAPFELIDLQHCGLCLLWRFLSVPLCDARISNLTESTDLVGSTTYIFHELNCQEWYTAAYSSRKPFMIRILKILNHDMYHISSHFFHLAVDVSVVVYHCICVVHETAQMYLFFSASSAALGGCPPAAIPAGNPPAGPPYWRY